MTALLLVGDVHDRMAQLDDHSFDLIITSPPFLALRSYLPDNHPDKHLEIGSEATPAEYLDVLLALTAEWRRLLAPHGSIAIELGDTYAGSGGAGGDYNPKGLRDGQPKFRQNNLYGAGSSDGAFHGGAKEIAGRIPMNAGPGWPLDKSLTGIPTLYTWSLAYGRNLLTGTESPAGQWRIRNLKPWIRTNPPVGALGDKERPATSYITVATLARDRWFDLDAVRTTVSNPDQRLPAKTPDRGMKYISDRIPLGAYDASQSAGAPPLDWYHTIDAIIDNELQQRNGKPAGSAIGSVPKGRTNPSGDAKNEGGFISGGGQSIGARGWHIRRALERAGILTTLDAHDISSRGYSGAHYAVWPPELCRQLIDEMCPRTVCVTCGEPSRRIVESVASLGHAEGDWTKGGRNNTQTPQSLTGNAYKRATGLTSTVNRTLGWTDCGHNTWRPGRILDPFVGSGTTLAVATGMARDAVGIDLDPRNAHLAEQRVGMFLEIDWGHLTPTTELPPHEIVAAVNEELL